MKRNIIIALALTAVISIGTVVGINVHHNKAANKDANKAANENTVTNEVMVSDIEEKEIGAEEHLNEEADELVLVEGANEEAKDNIDNKSSLDKGIARKNDASEIDSSKNDSSKNDSSKSDSSKKSSSSEDNKTNTTKNKKSVKEESSVHTHNYKKKVTVAPACVANGTITYTCECGSKYEESTPALGHNFADGPSCLVCGTANSDYVAPHTHTWTVEEHFTLNHTNEGHYAPYICECRLDFQNYEDLEAHQEETAIKSREAYRDENGVWHGDIAHGGWCNGWVVEREWDVYAVTHKEVCECGEVGKEWTTVEEVTCTCIHYGSDMHYHFADRDCCRG